MTESRRIYCLGDLNIDVLLAIDSYPELGGDSRSEKMVIEVGGSVTNSALLLNSLGDQAALLACLGDDLFAEFTDSALRSSGLDLDHLQTAHNQSTGMMFVPVTADGQRTLFGSRGANLQLQADLLPEDLADGDALLISGYALLDSGQAEASRRTHQMAQEADLFLAMDSAYEPPLVNPEAFQPFFEGLDLLVLGQEEATSLAGQSTVDNAIGALLDRGIATIGLKLGANGSRIFTKRENYHIPSIAEAVVDTTGAGDNFTAGLMHGILAGLSLPAAGLLASAAAAHIIGDWGAGRKAGSPKDLLQILKKSRPNLDQELDGPCQNAIGHLKTLMEN